MRGHLLFAQTAIRDIDLPRSVDCLFLQIGGNDFSSATILHVARDSIKLGGVAKLGICYAKSIAIKMSI